MTNPIPNDESATMGMEECEDGGFVRYSDYLAEIESLRDQLETVQQAHNNLVTAYTEVRDAALEEAATAIEVTGNLNEGAWPVLKEFAAFWVSSIRNLKSKATKGTINGN